MRRLFNMKHITRPLSYLLACVFLVLLWQCGAWLLGTQLVPAPAGVFTLLGQSLHSGTFWGHIAISAFRVISALLLAWVLAFPLGLILGHCRLADGLLAPLFFLTYPIPKIVLLPVFLTLFGLGELPRILLISLTVGYQILLVTRDSARNLNRQYPRSFRTLSSSTRELARHVYIPAALPAALTALRVASGTALAVLFMVESFATTRGLGYTIMDAWGRGDLDEMYAGILTMSVLGVLLYELCNLLEHYFCRWQSSVRQF